jgi:hypothetical protein
MPVRKERIRGTLHPKCVSNSAAPIVFRWFMAQTIEKYTNVTKPGVDVGLATWASTDEPSNANQTVIKIASSEDGASSSEGSEEGSNSTSSSDNLSALYSSEEEEQSETPASRRSPFQIPPLHHGGAMRTKTLSGACEVAGSAKHWRNQQMEEPATCMLI